MTKCFIQVMLCNSKVSPKNKNKGNNNNCKKEA